MISFKEFLKRKEVLSEDIKDESDEFFKKNENARAIRKWLAEKKKKGEIKDYNNIKFNSGELKSIIKEINKNIKDENSKIKEENKKEFKELFFKVANLMTDLKKNRTGDIGDALEDDSFKQEFYKSLINNKNAITNLNGNKIENIVGFFSKSNRDGNSKIDKNEFFDAINKIKKEYNNDLNTPAIILWLAYLRQLAFKSDRGIFTAEGGLNNNNIGPIKHDDFFFNDKGPTEKYEDLQLVFSSFGEFQLDDSVLKNFPNPSKALNFLKQDIETIKQKTVGNFTEKTQEEKEAEKQEEKEQQKKTEDEKKNADMDAEADAIAKKAEETLKNISSNKDDTDDEIMQKRNWFIFNTMPPKPGKPEEIAEFRNNIEKEIKEFIDKIGEGLDKFKVNKLASNNLDDDQVQEMIKSCIKKNGMIFEDNDVLAREFEAYQEKIENIKKYAKDDISSMMEKLCKEANTKNNEIENENDYRKTVNLQAKFKQLFINYGYKISNRIKEAIAEADDVIRKAKKNKNSDEILGHKTADQKGQEQKDIDRISKILNSTYNKDTMNLARYMLINLLNNLHSSEEVLKQLNKKTFDKEMFDNGYIYAGSSGKVYVPAMPQKTEVKGGMAYSFPLVKTESFKNPASLLNAVGISLSSLSADVLKGLKETASNLKTEAENYINAAKELYNLIQSTIGNGSTVTDGLFGPKANEDMSNFVKNVNNTNKSNDVLNKICQKINLKNNFEPENNQPDDIALRQFLKGFTLIVIGNDRYVTSVDAFEKNKEQLIGKEDEEQQINKTPQKNANDELTPDEKVKAQSIENNGKVGETYDSSATEQSSVVTSANADSTYGDGYGYSKKAKAIKKKLNSTTYTYSPNSKLKIVRRTFD